MPDDDTRLAAVLRDHGHDDIAQALEAKSAPPPTAADRSRDAALAEVLRNAGHSDVAESLEAKLVKPAPNLPEPTADQQFLQQLKDANDNQWSTSGAGLLEG